MEIESAIEYARENKASALGALHALLEIPSISITSKHKQDVHIAAEWVADKLEDLGCTQVEVCETPGLPLVVGSLAGLRSDAPTVLVYGHVDVMPPEPLEEWKSNPFKPEIRGDNIYARGATDMKAQLVAFLYALESIIRTSRTPVNVRFLIEGEEENGSSSLPSFIHSNKERLGADFCLNLDAGILAPYIPSIMYGLRGLAYFELTLTGPATDLHSGKFGGAIENPANVLCQLIAGMRDEHGRVTIPGFYDQVLPLSSEERSMIARLPQTDEWWLEQSGAPALPDTSTYGATERATARPTLDVHGLLSGFTGEGGMTVLPSTAMAKFSMRLVPEQTPEQIRRGLDSYLEDNVPPTVRWTLEEDTGCNPSLANLNHPSVQAAKQALEAVWGIPPLFTRDGGSVPVVGLIKDLLGMDSLLLGFGLPDDNPHGPNEKQHLPTFYRGVEAYIHFIDALAGGTS